MLDLFGRGFVLLRFGTADDAGVAALQAAAAERGVPLTVESIDDPSIAELYAQPLVLVRHERQRDRSGDEDCEQSQRRLHPYRHRLRAAGG